MHKDWVQDLTPQKAGPQTPTKHPAHGFIAGMGHLLMPLVTEMGILSMAAKKGPYVLCCMPK
jgi:hypothetical protein